MPSKRLIYMNIIYLSWWQLTRIHEAQDSYEVVNVVYCKTEDPNQLIVVNSDRYICN